MAANTSPIFPLTPFAISASLAAVTACTTRAPTVTASLAAATSVEFLANPPGGGVFQLLNSDFLLNWDF